MLLLFIEIQTKSQETKKEEKREKKKLERVHNYKYHYDERPVGVTSAADETARTSVEAKLDTASSSSDYSSASETAPT